MAVGGRDGGDSGGGERADSFEQMDEVSLRLPTVRRGPLQPGRYVAEVVVVAATGAGTTACLSTTYSINRLPTNLPRNNHLGSIGAGTQSSY